MPALKIPLTTLQLLNVNVNKNKNNHTKYFMISGFSPVQKFKYRTKQKLDSLELNRFSFKPNLIFQPQYLLLFPYKIPLVHRYR